MPLQKVKAKEHPPDLGDPISTDRSQVPRQHVSRLPSRQATTDRVIQDNGPKKNGGDQEVLGTASRSQKDAAMISGTTAEGIDYAHYLC